MCPKITFGCLLSFSFFHLTAVLHCCSFLHQKHQFTQIQISTAFAHLPAAFHKHQHDHHNVGQPGNLAESSHSSTKRQLASLGIHPVKFSTPLMLHQSIVLMDCLVTQPDLWVQCHRKAVLPAVSCAFLLKLLLTKGNSWTNAEELNEKQPLISLYTTLFPTLAH